MKECHHYSGHGRALLAGAVIGTGMSTAAVSGSASLPVPRGSVMSSSRGQKEH